MKVSLSLTHASAPNTLKLNISIRRKLKIVYDVAPSSLSTRLIVWHSTNGDLLISLNNYLSVLECLAFLVMHKNHKLACIENTHLFRWPNPYHTHPSHGQSGQVC